MPETTDRQRPYLRLVGARVTTSFRDAVIAAANREGVSVNEFVLNAAAERLTRIGTTFDGVFRSGDTSTARTG